MEIVAVCFLVFQKGYPITKLCQKPSCYFTINLLLVSHLSVVVDPRHNLLWLEISFRYPFHQSQGNSCRLQGVSWDHEKGKLLIASCNIAVLDLSANIVISTQLSFYVCWIIPSLLFNSNAWNTLDTNMNDINSHVTQGILWFKYSEGITYQYHILQS